MVQSGYLVDVFRRFGVSALRFPTRYRSASGFAREVRYARDSFPIATFTPCTMSEIRCVRSRLFRNVAGSAANSHRRRSAAPRAGGSRSRAALRNVKFLGQVSPDRMPALFDSDIYLDSSDIDNMPTSILEAFAAGTPVITTNAGGIPYIVSDSRTAMVVNCNDAEAMAK